jgi:peroxiredoxin
MRLKVGDAVPNFNAKTSDGKDISLDGDIKKGKPVLMNIMQTACSACLMEMELLASVKETYKGKYDIWTVSVDLREGEALAKYLEANPQFKDFTFILDKKFEIGRLLGLNSTPALAMIGTDGKLAFKMIGYGPADKDEFDAALKELK